MADIDVAKAEVLAANEAFYGAFNQKDPELMARVWSDSDRVTCIHPGWNVLQGRESVLESWNSILRNPDQPRIVTGGADVSFYGGLALVICRELVGGSPLVATNVFVKEGGAWKLLHHQSGPVYAGAGG
jgi:ketosteroid isomerase-like protein